MDDKTADRVMYPSLDYFSRSTFFSLLAPWLADRRGNLPPPVADCGRLRRLPPCLQTHVLRVNRPCRVTSLTCEFPATRKTWRTSGLACWISPTRAA